MSGNASGARPGQPPHDLAARLFRALYPELDLRVLGDLHVAVPKGAPCYTGRTLSEIVRQISTASAPGPDRDPGGQPGCSHAGNR